MKVLLTRPLEEAQRTAQKLIAMGHMPIIPLAQALIVTSPRALHLVKESALPIFKLHTTGQALAQEIAKSPYQHFLWLTSDKRAFDLVGALPHKQIEIVKAYEMREIPFNFNELMIDAALHYSQESAKRVLQGLHEPALILHCALSQRIAAVIPPHFRCKIAATPNEMALLKLLEG
jgi:uroporphyrinogen-III synthase